MVSRAVWVGVVLFCPLLYHAQWPPAIFNDERSMKYGTSAQKQEIKYETQNHGLCFPHQGYNDFMTLKNIILSIFYQKQRWLYWQVRQRCIILHRGMLPIIDIGIFGKHPNITTITNSANVSMTNVGMVDGSLGCCLMRDIADWRSPSDRGCAHNSK